MKPRRHAADEATAAADRIARECLFGRSRHLTRRLTALYDDAVRELGVTAAQVNVLVTLERAGGLPAARLAEKMGMSPSSASRTLARMQQHGWLRMGPGDDDRSQRVEIAEAGRRLILAALPRWEGAQRQAEALLGEGGADAFRALVNGLNR